MDDEGLNKLIENEKEWRRHLFEKVQRIEDKVNGLQLKQIVIVAVFGSTFGMAGGELGKHVLKLLK